MSRWDAMLADLEERAGRRARAAPPPPPPPDLADAADMLLTLAAPGCRWSTMLRWMLGDFPPPLPAGPGRRHVISDTPPAGWPDPDAAPVADRAGSAPGSPQEGRRGAEFGG